MAAALLAVIDPGDEVLIFEPFYENYGPDAILCGAKPGLAAAGRRAPLDLDAAGAPSRPGRAPSSSTRRTTRRAACWAGGARRSSRRSASSTTSSHHRRDLRAHRLRRRAHADRDLDGMRERTITISGASKTFSVTGWRIGWIVAPPDLTDAIRKVHDFLTVGAPAPLQEACAAAIETLGRDYYDSLAPATASGAT
jgi:aspartate/methionine/tyrosine aminotransferase